MHGDANLPHFVSGWTHTGNVDGSTDLEGTIDLAILHEILPRDGPIPLLPRRIHVFSEVQPHVPEHDPFAPSPRRVFLHDFEIDVGLLQHAVAINRQADREDFGVVPGDFVLADDFFRGAAAVFGRCRGGEVPFYVGGAGDEGNVVEVDDLMDRQYLILKWLRGSR